MQQTQIEYFPTFNLISKKILMKQVIKAQKTKHYVNIMHLIQPLSSPSYKTEQEKKPSNLIIKLIQYSIYIKALLYFPGITYILFPHRS